MLHNRKHFLMWRRQVFVRNPNDQLNTLFATATGGTGIYLIGCAAEIVYVGQSWNIRERPLESLGRVYHRVSDTSLPWSLALAPCSRDEMDERESTAIRAYAPRFNTSIPSIPKSEGRMPEIVGVAAVFQDQSDTCGAFQPDNLRQQMEKARVMSDLPWRQGKQRKKSGKPAQPRKSKMQTAPTQPAKLSEAELEELLLHYGVPADGPLVYPVNLCDDGSVINNDGEYLGTWSMDEYEHPSFTPDGAEQALLSHVLVGLLCYDIRDWHAKQQHTETE
ncbi:MAG: hypothetical protein AAFW87_12460 [Pseudomonadota bacterium]